MAKRKPLMVVAIDFGTVYSGYAFSTRSDFRKNPTNIHANQKWSGKPSLMSEKTPTCLLLTPSRNFAHFGYEAEDKYATLALHDEHRDWYFFKRFKMKLHGDQQIDEYMNIEDECGKPLPAITVFSESIGYLTRHFLQKRTALSLPITDDDIMWVLTVPAIWNDTAKRFMRNAAVKAGIKSTNLMIALEPEAASIFCRYDMADSSDGSQFALLRPGIKYMMIDLGGGTADITVHKVLQGGGVEEICKASGGIWGGTVVDDNYTQLLTRIFGGPTIHQFRRNHMDDYVEMLRDFEVRKRNINFNERDDQAFRLPYKLNEICNELNEENITEISQSPNFPYKGSIVIRADKMIFNANIVKHLFKSVTDQIVDHVADKIKENNLEDLSLMILVGGFSESSFVQGEMRSAFESKRLKLIITQEPSLSVVKGAVIFGHDKSQIKSRVLRYTYGTSPHAAFDPDKYPESRRCQIGGKSRVKLFKPFIKAGTSVQVGYSITKRYPYSEWHFTEDSILQVFVSSNPCCRYPDDDGCQLLAQIPVGRLLPEVPHKKRTVDVDYIFGDTEVEMIVREEATDFIYNDRFDIIE